MIEFVCPHCKNTLKIPEQYLGQAGKCNRCGEAISILVAPPPMSPEEFDTPDPFVAEPPPPPMRPAPLVTPLPGNLDGDSQLTREQILKAKDAIGRALQTNSSPSDRQLLISRYQELDALLNPSPSRILAEETWIDRRVSPPQFAVRHTPVVVQAQEVHRRTVGWEESLRRVGVSMTACGCFLLFGLPVLIFIGFMAWVAVFPGPPRTPTVPDKSPQMQANRQGFINDAIAMGVFQKVEPIDEWGNVEVWVEPGFYLLDFEQKKDWIKVVYCYYFDGTDQFNRVDVYDRFSGKKVASFSGLGFEMK